MRFAPRASEPPSPNFQPVLIADVEIAEPLPPIAAAQGESGLAYGAVQCLVRLHGLPLGFVRGDLPPRGLEPADLADLIWTHLAERIERHLAADGLAPPVRLEASGLAVSEPPACATARERSLRDPPFVSVVIPTRNRPDSVAATLTKIVASSYPRDRFEAIVVDNGSGEDAMVDPAGLGTPDDLSLRVLREASPGGSHARNRGLGEASGEIVVFADDDIDADPDWLVRMVRPFVEDDAVAGVAGLTIPSELETPSQIWFEGFGGFMRGFERRVYDLAEPPPDRPLFPFTVGDFGSGQNMAFRRAVLQRLGGFDPDLGTATPTHAGEDLEAMLRVLVSGHRVVYEPAAIVRHEHQREFEQFRRRVWGYGVGLTACLTKAVVENPRLLVTLLGKLPRGLAYALSPGSGKNENKQSDYPRRLTRLELRGMAYGPFAYARSRRGRRRRGGAASGAGRPAPGRGPLRTLIVTDSHPPLIGGANRSVELLSRGLAERGHSVSVATVWQEGLPEFEESEGVEIHRIRDLTSRMRWISEDPYKHNPPPFPDPEAIARLRRLIRDIRPDLVHAYGWLAHSAAAALRDGEAPLLLSVRDYGNICAVRTLVRKGEGICSGPGPAKCLDCASWTYGLPKGLVASASVLGVGPLLRRRVTTVHSVSNFVAAEMERHLRVPGALSRVIPNFHEDTSEAAVDPDLMKLLPERPFILFVGAFRLIKGIEETLEAYARLDDPPPFVMVGTRATDTPKSFPPDGVTVIEDVPHPTVMAMWERAMFGVLATRAPEALGNVVHEAMSKGRPVIGSRPGGQEDMIEDGESGLLVPIGDVDALTAAMARLIRDEQLRERLGKRAGELAAAYTPEVVMPRLENLYYDTLAHFHGARA